MSSKCSANCYTKGIQIIGSGTVFCLIPILLFYFHHSQGICTGKNGLGGQGLNKGRKGVENKSKKEKRAGGKKGMLV